MIRSRSRGLQSITESLGHDALQLLGAKERLQEQAELHRTIFQELGDLGEVFRHQGLPVGLDVRSSQSAKAHFSADATRHT